MEENKNIEVLDYHEFYTEFKDGGYLPLRINDEWLLENENYLRENLFSFYLVYSNHTVPADIMNILFRLFAEVTLNTYTHFENRGQLF
ncbi:MAG: hypothetical protein LBM02_09940 [Lachnospiraceae bacterium]|jgi:hypothetical protein|nr:hypothetical protein [Lachnospiraceae bacterium]